jgi:hypothetical protein
MNKFLKMCESVMGRLERGGVLVGDVVKVTASDVPEQYRAAVQEMIDAGINIKVVDIVNHYPSDKPGSSMNSNGETHAVIALDYGGGRYVSRVTVPTASLEVVERHPNLDPIPDAIRRDNQVTLKPEPVEQFDQEQHNKADVGDQKLEPAEQTLAQQNTEIPSEPVEGVKDPGEFKPATYTGMYMPSQ